MKSFVANQYSPFEIVLCILFGTYGVLQMFYGPPAGSSTAVLPTPFRIFWLAFMVVGCVVTLYGLSINRVWGYIVERVGLLATGWSLVVLGLAVLSVQISRGNFTATMIVGGPLITALGYAFLWKAKQVKHYVESLPKC